ncbi:MULTISPECIES: carbohydrate ABC transporter permease [Micromonospora]|uniref:carbohydrate ABC transporter permease n=1 Tax=Micromonospora TaxID=1873 RepID=UPI0031CF5CD3
MATRTDPSAPVATRATAPAPPAPPRRRGVNWRRVGNRAWTGLVIAVLLVITIYPLFWMFASSLKTENEFITEPLWSLPRELNFQNYVDAWELGGIGTVIRNSLLVTLPSLFFILALGAAAGFALEVMVWKGRNTVLLLIVGGMMLPLQLILLPLFTIYFRLGLTDSLLPLILTYVGHGLPLTVFLMAAYFRAVPRELFEASTLDGAGVFRAFFSVGLPMVRNGLLTLGLLMFFSVWNDLLIALTFNTSKELSTIQVGLLNFNGEYGSTLYGPLFAGICTTVLGILVIYVFINKQIMKGLAAGSLKG